MAAPVATGRINPSSAGEIPLDDGFSTQISFQNDPNVAFWEKSVQPPGLDGGDAIDTTTMLNTAWRTLRARQLVTLTEIAVVASYDPVVYSQILALVNVEGSVTIIFPDDSTLAFFGYLRVFTPGEHVEGTPPECNITIQPTNWDPVNNVEAAPVLSETAGT